MENHSIHMWADTIRQVASSYGLKLKILNNENGLLLDNLGNKIYKVWVGKDTTYGTDHGMQAIEFIGDKKEFKNLKLEEMLMRIHD